MLLARARRDIDEVVNDYWQWIENTMTMEETSWLKVIRNLYEGTVTRRVTDDTLPGGPIERTVTYHAPFDRCNREQDYRMAPSTVRIVPRQIRGSASSGVLVCLEEIGSGYAGLGAYGSQSRCLQSRMAGHRQWGHASIRILPPHGDVVTFTYDLESECLTSLDYAAFMSVAREAGHQIATPDSATNASMTGESSAIDSSPNV